MRHFNPTITLLFVVFVAFLSTHTLFCFLVILHLATWMLGLGLDHIRSHGLRWPSSQPPRAPPALQGDWSVTGVHICSFFFSGAVTRQRWEKNLTVFIIHVGYTRKLRPHLLPEGHGHCAGWHTGRGHISGWCCCTRLRSTVSDSTEFSQAQLNTS